MEREQDKCATRAEGGGPGEMALGLNRRIEEVAGRLAPTTTEKHHDVRVFKVENGFVLHVGCKMFVAKNWEEASSGLAEYWKDPIAAQKKYANS